MIKNILVPYDGSPLSKKALDLAKDISRNFNADLKLFMVIPNYYPISDSVYSGTAVMNYQRVVKSLTEQGEKEIQKITEKCREEGSKASYKIVHDDISNAILKESKRSKSDLIVMGSRRLTGIASLKRLGSTARHVSEHAKCPVTIVH
ncbi:MAG TPA: universal stress protein [Candidatus Nitrosotalea sp.]|nr:universal stress protein [Candidatus Nitrosotalea sp.]